jgi:hypothetical protein
MSRLQVHRTLFVQDFLKLCVIAPRLLATRVALDIRNFLVWLALSGVTRVVSLALVEVVVAVALLFVVALGEVVVLLVLLVSPPCNIVT